MQTIEYQFEQLEIEETGIVEANGFATIAYNADEWWVLSIYQSKEVGAIPSKSKAIYDDDGKFLRYEDISPRIPGVIVTTPLDKDSRYYGAIRAALEAQCDGKIWDEINEDGSLPARRGNEHSTLNHAQQGISL